MPKKTAEEVREKVVQLRKQGRTYTQIEREAGIGRPTLCKILKEAGLTVPGGKSPGRPSAAFASSATGPTSAASPQTTVAVSKSSIPTATAGLEEFMPKQPEAKKPKLATEAGEMVCDNCEEEFQYEAGDEMPDSCPECGA